MSSMKRKRNVVTIERKLETIDQLAIRVRVSFLVVHNNIGIVIRLSEPSFVPISSDNRHSSVYTKERLLQANIYLLLRHKLSKVSLLRRFCGRQSCFSGPRRASNATLYCNPTLNTIYFNVNEKVTTIFKCYVCLNRTTQLSDSM